MEFEAYLASKRIDSARFSDAEPQLWQSWKSEFEQLHPNSFTVQKLNLINPIRRKYQLIVTEPVSKPAAPKPAAPKPALPVKPATPVVDANEQPIVSAGDAPAPAKVVPKIPRPGMPKPVIKPSAAAGSSQEIPSASVTKSPEPVDDSGKSQETVINSAPSPDSGTLSSSTITEATPITNNPASQQRDKASDPSPIQADGEKPAPTSETGAPPSPAAKPAKPVIPRPVIKPKPKPN